MEENPDKWWQIRLSNLFGSMVLFGAALAIGKAWQALVWQGGSNNPVVCLTLTVSGLVALGGMTGALFGRFKRGAVLGLAAFGVLVIVYLLDYWLFKVAGLRGRDLF